MVTDGHMLDTRLYRAAFVPVLLAVLVAAFALSERPRPIGTTLAPDAFDGRKAYATLTELARTFPRTRPGSAGDDAMAERVESVFKGAGFQVRTSSTTAQTIDGEQALTSVIGERPGLDPRRIVVVAHRDRVREGDTASLSGTAALLELARLYEGRPIRRTLTLVSTSGGTGGMAGLRDTLDGIGGDVDAVLVVGDVASRAPVRRPYVIPWADNGGLAPSRLRRTVESALRTETDLDPGQPRALVQLARLAMPLTLTPQGVVGGAGLSGVTIQASGERGPAPATADRVSRARIQAFGRGLLRSISALDNGPAVPAGPRDYLIFQRQALPRWAVTVIAGLLLLPALIGAVDGLARVRRRRHAVAPWVRWLAVAALPFLLVATVARLLGFAGAVPRLPGAVLPDAVPVQAAPLIILALLLAAGFAARGPVARAFGVPARPTREEVPGAAAAVALVSVLLAIAVLLINPYTALLLAPAIHLWLLAVAPEVELPRPALVAMALLGLVPLALLGVFYGALWDLGPAELAWSGVLLLAGGTVGIVGAVLGSAVLACCVGAVGVAVRKRRSAKEEGGPGGSVTIRGPLSYAGPGSLGGTSSAIRR